MLIETGASIDWRNPGPERGCPEVCVESYSNHYHCHCNRSSPFSFSLSTMCDHQSDSHNFHYHDHIFILLLSYFHRLMIILKPGKSGATTLDCASLRHDDGQLRCGEYYHDWYLWGDEGQLKKGNCSEYVLVWGHRHSLGSAPDWRLRSSYAEHFPLSTWDEHSCTLV